MEDAILPERVLLSVRPECVVVQSGAQTAGAPGAANRFPGRVEGASFSGASVECRVTVEGHTLRATLRERPGGWVPRIGDTVTVHVPAEDVVRLEVDGLSPEAHDAPPVRSRRALLALRPDSAGR